jgi:PEP-CTERM motif
VGGFDPILTLFAGSTASGTPLAVNDDGGPALVATDPNTGRAWDSYIKKFLSAGTYTVAISEYNNFWNVGTQMWTYPNPPANNFTGALAGCTNGSFCDVSGAAPFNNRTNQYGWQITAAPEPVSIALLGTGLIGLAVARRRKKRA